MTADSRRLFAALVVSFALLQAFTFLPSASGAPDFCDKPGNGNDKKCETPTPPPPTPTLPPPTQPPTATPPPVTPDPTVAPDPTATPGGETAAPSEAPSAQPSTPPTGPPSATPSVKPSQSPAPTGSPAPSQTPTKSPDPTQAPTVPPTSTPTTLPTTPPVVTPPPPTELPVITPPPVETQPPLPPTEAPTPLVTQPPNVPGQPVPPLTDPTTPVGPEPLAPTETDDPRGRGGLVLFPGAGDGGGPQSPIVEAIEDLAGGAVEAGESKPSDVAADEAGHAFGLRIPLGASIGELARTAGQAVQEFAFPLTLAIAVLLFLLFQGELDRRDPKLAYAPVDSTKDMVSFE